MRMRLDQSVRNLSDTKDEIDAFNTECEEREHTDIGDVWTLLGNIRASITDVLDSWDSK